MYTNIILAATTSSTIATTTTSPEINHIVPQLEHNHKSSMASSNDTFSIAKTIASPTTTQPSLLLKLPKIGFYHQDLNQVENKKKIPPQPPIKNQN